MNPYEPVTMPSQWYDVASIRWGEVLDGNLDGFGTLEEWPLEWYSDEQRERFIRKFNDRYMWREVSIYPLGEWRQQFIRLFNELAPKYALLYKAVEDPDFDPTLTEQVHHKQRDIGSDFPQTMLGANADYASRGNDMEYLHNVRGDIVAKLQSIASGYKDVDVMYLDELGVMFSNLVSVSYNGF